MTLDQLETFVQVARTRSFSRAAILQSLAQPTVSGRISALEVELGVELFARKGHTLDLTEPGRSLLPYAERMLALRIEGSREVARVRDGGLGRLALGANPTSSQYLVPRLLERYWQDHPKARVWVRTALSPVLMEGLLDGLIQLAICSRAQIHPSAQVLWTYSEPLLVVAAASHPLARKGICRRADLAGHAILSTQAGPTHLGLRHVLPPGMEHQIMLEATAGEVMTRLLLAGIGVTVLPPLAIVDELARGELVAITIEDADLPQYEVALVAWPGRNLSPAVQAFVSTTQQADMRHLFGENLSASQR